MNKAKSVQAEIEGEKGGGSYCYGDGDRKVGIPIEQRVARDSAERLSSGATNAAQKFRYHAPAYGGGHLFAFEVLFEEDVEMLAHAVSSLYPYANVPGVCPRHPEQISERIIQIDQ